MYGKWINVGIFLSFGALGTFKVTLPRLRPELVTANLINITYPLPRLLNSLVSPQSKI